MNTFGWVLLAGAFLLLMMVANNSWPWVWARIQRGIPQPGEGNPIVPTPTQPGNITGIPPSSGVMPGTIVPNP